MFRESLKYKKSEVFGFYKRINYKNSKWHIYIALLSNILKNNSFCTFVDWILIFIVYNHCNKTIITWYIIIFEISYIIYAYAIFILFLANYCVLLMTVFGSNDNLSGKNLLCVQNEMRMAYTACRAPRNQIQNCKRF